MEEGSGPQGHLRLQPQESPTVEDMYKVTSRIVLALRSPSGFRLEIRGGQGSSDRRWGMGNWGLPSSHPGDEEGMESYPSAQATASHRGGRAGVGKSVQGTLKAIAF